MLGLLIVRELSQTSLRIPSELRRPRTAKGRTYLVTEETDNLLVLGDNALQELHDPDAPILLSGDSSHTRTTEIVNGIIIGKLLVAQPPGRNDTSRRGQVQHSIRSALESTELTPEFTRDLEALAERPARETPGRKGGTHRETRLLLGSAIPALQQRAGTDAEKVGATTVMPRTTEATRTKQARRTSGIPRGGGTSRLRRRRTDRRGRRSSTAASRGRTSS